MRAVSWCLENAARTVGRKIMSGSRHHVGLTVPGNKGISGTAIKQKDNTSP